MKKWTVVIEIADNADPESTPGYLDRNYLTRSEVEGMITIDRASADKSLSFRIMETIEAPYGPQHSGGVFIAEMKCICRKGSSFVNPNCKATVHHP